jgi:hypothetical protein
MEGPAVLCVTYDAKRFVLSIVSSGRAACSCSSFTRSMCMLAVVKLGSIAPCVSNKQACVTSVIHGEAPLARTVLAHLDEQLIQLEPLPRGHTSQSES